MLIKKWKKSGFLRNKIYVLQNICWPQWLTYFYIFCTFVHALEKNTSKDEVKTAMKTCHDDITLSFINYIFGKDMALSALFYKNV